MYLRKCLISLGVRWADPLPRSAAECPNSSLFKMCWDSEKAKDPNPWEVKKYLMLHVAAYGWKVRQALEQKKLESQERMKQNLRWMEIIQQPSLSGSLHWSRLMTFFLWQNKYRLFFFVFHGSDPLAFSKSESVLETKKPDPSPDSLHTNYNTKENWIRTRGLLFELPKAARGHCGWFIPTLKCLKIKTERREQRNKLHDL